MNVCKEPESRAVQFATFDALRGYADMVETCAFVPDVKIELDDEEIEKLNHLLSALQIGATATVTYYFQEQYVTLTDTVREVDPITQALTLGKTKVPFAEIWSIEGGTER